MRLQTSITAIVLAPVAAFASAPTELAPVTVGELSFEIRPRRGPVLCRRGLVVVEGAYLRFHSPDWKTMYLGLAGRAWDWFGSASVSDLVEGGKRVIVTGSERGGVTLRLTFDLRPRARVEMTAEYSYRAGSPPCNLEYTVAALHPGPLAGQWCTVDDERKRLPLNPAPESKRTLFRAPRLTIHSRLGNIRVSPTDDRSDTFAVVDWRAYGRNQGLASFLLIRSARVVPGETATLRTVMEFLPEEGSPASTGDPADRPEQAPEPLARPARYEFPLIPAPKTVAKTDGAFDCARPLRLIARSNASEQEKAYLRTFAADLEHLLGARPDVHTDGGATRGRPVAWITTGAAPGRWEPSSEGGWGTKPEGYAIEMRPDGIAIAGADLRGLWYGTRMAYQIVANAGDDRPGEPRAPCLAITNWPDHRIRGLHLPLKINTDFELLASLMKCLALYHHNLVVIEVHDAVRYEAQPLGSAPHAYGKHVVRHLVELGQRYGLEVVPGLNSLGHIQEWLFQPYRLDRLAEFRELIEDPSRPTRRRERTLCPSNPKGRELLFGIYDELLELFKPKRFLVGLDEAFDWAECRRCKGKDPARLFANHINALNDYFRARQVQMIMFQDLFLEKKNWPLGPPCHSQGTAPALDLIPRENILMCCWQYSTHTEYPAFKHFVDRRFQCVGASWFQPENIWGYSRYVQAHGGQGMIGTTWTPHGWGPRHWQIRTDPSRLAAYVRGGDAFWSCNLPKTAPGDEGYDAEAEIERHYARSRRDRRAKFSPVDIDRWRNWGLSDAIAGDRAPAAFDHGPDHDVSCLVGCSAGMGGIPFSGLDTGKAIALRGAWEPNVQAPGRVEGLAVGRPARALLFLHTCGWETPRGTPVARYTVHFDDGTDQIVDVLYGRDILAFDGKSFIYEKLDRQTARLSLVGRTRLGRAVRFHTLRWENPRPAVPIESVDLASLGTIAAPMVLAITTENR